MIRSIWVAAGATIVCFVASEAAAAPTFSSGSFWYTPIPANVTLHPNSANFRKEFLRQKSAYYGTVAINTLSYSSPVYIAPSGAARVAVGQWDCQNKGYSNAGLTEQWKSVPIPSHALPADGSDAEMTVYQPSTNSVWEFWRARKVDGKWQGCWGGGMTSANTNPGIWTNPYGTTATGLPFLGGQITAEELQRGVIEHAIGIALVDLEKKTIFSWPASRSDGYNPNNLLNRIPAGLRFRLDPTVNVEALNLSPVGKIIARAAQKYGFVVWDKAGAISLRAQNVKSYTQLGKPNPYTTLFAGTPSYAVLNGFPWDRIQFLPMDYGKARTTTTRTGGAFDFRTCC